MGTPEGVALTLAPLGRDNAILVRMLEECDIAARTCVDVAELAANLADNIRLVVLTEEAVRTSDLRAVADWIGAQPSWSDLPFILLTFHGGGSERNTELQRLQEILGNVSIIERPFHPTTLISVARTAARGRARQYEARARLEELRSKEAHLQRLAETLEQRVEERTAAQIATHNALMREAKFREDAERKLLQAQKLEAIGRLTGGIAHDFNNLLSAVLGNIELLQKRLPDDPRFRDLLANARQGAERGAALTQRMLAFARRQDLTVAPVDVGQLIDSMISLFKQSTGPKIDLSVDIESELPAALIDANQVELAVLNLIVNASDAMPDGGSIRVAVERPPAHIAPSGLAAALCISVTDTGEGMSEDVLAHAIEPFFTTKELGKGTGLGLAMIHGLATQMKGALRLESTVGLGTRAELWLPIAQDDPVPIAQEPANPLAAASGSRRILIVDDDLLVSMNAQMMAEDLGHHVTVAASGPDALSILENDCNFDLVMTDQAMPKMTGLALASRISEQWPHIRIILASGYADLANQEGIDVERLDKPYTLRMLADTIDRVMSGPVEGLHASKHTKAGRH